MKYQAIRPPATEQATPARLTLRAKTNWVAVFLLVLCAAPAPAADPYAEALDKRIANLDNAVERQAHEMAQGRPDGPDSEAESHTLLWGTVGVVAAIIALRLVLQILCGRRKPEKSTRRNPPNEAEPLVSEPSSGASLSEHMGMDPAQSIQSAAAPGLKHPQQSTEGTARFFKFAPPEITEALNLLQSASRAEDPAFRQRILRALCERLRYLCYSTRPPELRPAWQLSVSSEALVRNLAASGSTGTASALRTAADALGVLRELCTVGDNLLFAADSAASLLVVDDDPVSRFAMSAALRGAFNQPELASDGQTALVMAAKQPYEAIFLDVELPGMDGFELCTRLRNTPLNATTPVVFVTRHDDFESRAKAAETGGHDLIAKPFLPSEIKLKALTLVFHSRLERRCQDIHGTKEVLGMPTPTPEAKINTPAPAGSQSRARAPMPNATTDRAAREAVMTAGLTPGCIMEPPPSHAVEQLTAFDAPKTPAMLQGSIQDCSESVFSFAPRHLRALKDRLQDAILADDSAVRQELLGAAYVGLHSLTVDAERASAQVFARFGASLQALLRIFLNQPEALTPSRLEAATEAVSFLEELCRRGEEPALEQPPVRILIVDDDPICRRAIASAIETVFGKAEMASCGEEALTLANQTTFDLIMLEMFLPDIDGLTTCAQLRQTQQNEATPIVFVTGERQLEPLHPGGISGGCGFILKPFFAAEITLMALTFAFRGRLAKQTRPARLEEVSTA